MSRASLPIGTRVVAVSHNEGKNLFVFGRGVFEGYFLPPHVNLAESLVEIQKEYATQAAITPDLPADFTEEEARKAILLSESNPRIHLTETIDGQPLDAIVWGYECWWSDEADFQKNNPAGRYTIVTTTVEEHRIAVAKAREEQEQFEAGMLAAATQSGGVIEEN